MSYLQLLTIVFVYLYLADEKCTAAPQDTFCPDHVPCGWAVYNPLTRNVVYIMHNTCICQSPKLCLKSDDDLSANAYVHRCRERTSSTSSELSNG